MKVVLRFGFWWLLVPATALVAFIAFLLYTSVGARLVAVAAEAWVPQLSIEQLDGNIAYGLRAAHVRWQQPEVTVDLNGVATVWDPACVFEARFCVHSVAAGELMITLPDGQSDSSSSGAFSPLDLPLVLLPWRLQLDRLFLSRITIVASKSEMQIGPVDVKAQWSGTRVSIEYLKAAMDDKTVGSINAHLSGVLDMRSKWPVDLSLDTRYVPPLEQWQAQTVHLRGQGNLRDLHLAADAKGELHIPGMDALQLDAAITTRGLDTAAQIHKLSGIWNGAPIQADGGVRFSHDGVLSLQQLNAHWGENHANLTGTLTDRWNVQGTLALTQPQLLAPDAEGRFDGEVAITGERADPLVSVSVTSENLTMDDLVLADLKINAQAKPVSLTAVQVDASAQTLQLAQVPFQELTLHLDGDATSHRLALTGRSDAYRIAARAEGSLDTVQWNWKGQVQQLMLSLNHSWILRLQQPVALQWRQQQQRLQWDEACITDESARICSRGNQWLAKQQGDLRLTIQQFELEKLQPWLAEQMLPSGTVDGQLQIAGPWSNPQIKGPLRVHQLALRAPDAQASLLQRGDVDIEFSQRNASLNAHMEMPAGVRWQTRTAANVQWDKSQFRVDKTCWDVTRLATDKQAQSGLGYWCLQADLDPQQGLKAHGDILLSVSDALRPLLPETLGVQGRLQGETDIKVKGRDVTGTFNANISDGALQVEQADTGLPVVLPFHTLKLQATLAREILQADLQFDSEKLGTGHAGGQVDVRAADPELTLQAQLSRFNISVLRPLVPQLNALSGTVDAHLDVKGPASGPSVRGEVVVNDMQMQSATVPMGIDDLDARAVFDGEHGRLEGTLISGKGKADLSGQMELDGQGWNAKFHLKGKDIPVRQLPDIKLELQPDLTLVANRDLIRITGSIQASDGFLVLKPLPEDAVSVSPDVVFVDKRGNILEQSTGIATSAQIAVSVDPNVRIRGFGGEVRLKGTLQVTMDTNGIIIGRGSIDIVDGSYTGYGQQLTIRKGQLIFNGPLDQPFLNIEAVRVVDTVTAGMRLTGPADEPKVTLFSEPSMPDSKILYYIITGKAPGTGTTDENAMVQNALLSLGLRGGQPLARDLASKVGIEDLQVGASGSGDTTEVTVSGYLNSRTYLEYGINVFQPFNTLTLRYRLGENLFLEAVSGIASALDLLYSFEF